MEETELELHDDFAEAYLLGAVAFHGRELASVLAKLPGKDFWNPHRGHVWDACRALSEAGDPTDPATVARKLAELNKWNPGTENIIGTDMLTAQPTTFTSRYADTVADLARRRELMQALKRARKTIMSHPGDASEVLASVRGEFEESTKAQDTRHGGSLGWDQLIAEFRTAHAPDNPSKFIETPWPEYDDKIGGLGNGRVYVFGGRPGQGKSTAALNIAAYAAIDCGQKVLVISKEMPTVDVTGRILARGAEVNLKDINARNIQPSGMANIDRYLNRIGQTAKPSLSVDARPRKLSGVLALARSHHQRVGLDLLVVDYLQLVKTDTTGRNREQEVAQVSSELKALALELDCVVVLPAQLNRGSLQRADPRPTMSDLRDSGQIEQDADVVTLLHRERNPAGDYTGLIQFIIDKNRHGPTGDVTLNWNGGYGLIA